MENKNSKLQTGIVYYIYEVVGIKIGCTDNIDRRIKQLVKRYSISPKEIIVLEEHTCIDKASERELLLQAEKGYAVDKQPYSYVRLVQQPKAMNPKLRKEKVYDKVNGPRRKPIEAFNDGVSVGRYISHWQAAKELNLNNRYISAVLSPNRPNVKSTGGYTFVEISN